MAKIRAIGTTITFGGTAIGKLSSIGEVAPQADELDVTTLDSSGGYKEFLQGFKDSGECVLEGKHDKTDAGQVALRTGYGTGTAAAVVITFPDSATVGFSAYVKAYKIGAAAVDGAVGFGATLRITGAVTVTV